jgi:Ni/Fe-hydrogenase subunit HybB-like protein
MKIPRKPEGFKERLVALTDGLLDRTAEKLVASPDPDVREWAKSENRLALGARILTEIVVCISLGTIVISAVVMALRDVYTAIVVLYFGFLLMGVAISLAAIRLAIRAKQPFSSPSSEQEVKRALALTVQISIIFAVALPILTGGLIALYYQGKIQ